MTRNSFRKLSFILTAVVLSGTLYLSTTYATLAPLTPPPSGGYDAGTNSILDPGCAPTDTDCFVKPITADNGLTATGSNVQLGGILMQNTLIDQDGNDFAILNGNFSFQSAATTSIGVPGVISAYNDSTTNTAVGVIDLGAPADKFPAMFHSYDNGSDITSSAYFFNGITSGGIYSSSIAWSTTYQSSTEHYESEMNNLHRRTYFQNKDLNTGLKSLFTNDANNGITFTFGDNINPDSFYTFPRTDGTVGQVLTTNGSGVLSWQNAGGGSGWSLTGNAGTDGGVTNFVGTTDVQDLVLKTNGNEIARFGQSGNVSLGSSFGMNPPPIASGLYSFATGVVTTASGDYSTVLGSASVASGDTSMALGYNIVASSFSELALGAYNTIYTPNNTTSWQTSDRLVTIGNGNGLSGNHNAFTLWKDGSFAYNDDNFQNDINDGTEQNMFYFNYGNHDGLGISQSKSAIRLGSVRGGEADLNGFNVGDRSVAIGFAEAGFFGKNAPIASGFHAIAIGASNVAGGAYSLSLGRQSEAAGDDTFAFGIQSVAQGIESIALGSAANAKGTYGQGFGLGSSSYSYAEMALGTYNTFYLPSSETSFSASDRMLVIGNGASSSTRSDAFTILKNGEIGIGINNFEANTNGNIFQVGDSTTNIIGYVDDVTGNWVAVSDERKKDNITDLTYGLDQVLQLRPTSFNYKRNGEHTIGFIAQQVLPIIPEAVYGSESEGYGMSYATLTPVLVKAIQEMNLNITDINNTETPNTWRNALIAWFANTTNGITEFIAGTVRAKNNICIDDVCIDKEQLRTLLQNNNITPSPSPIPGPTGDDDVVSSGNDDQILPVDNPSDDGTDTGSSDQVVTPSTDTPAPVDTPTPIE